VLHVFAPESRGIYDLEHLWADAPRVEWRAVVEQLSTDSASRSSALLRINILAELRARFEQALAPLVPNPAHRAELAAMVKPVQQDRFGDFQANSAMPLAKAVRAELEKTGIKILYVKSLSDNFVKTADNIRIWGGITGANDAAEALAAEFEARVNRIKEIMAPYAAGPSIFQDVGGLWSPGPNTLVGEVFALLKLQNIAHDVDGYAQISPEVIVQRNPQVILADDPQAFTTNPAFKEVLAVRNNQVLTLSPDLLNVAGPRFVDGIEELGRLIYPALFRDLGATP
jgi:hypothetical protein